MRYVSVLGQETAVLRSDRTPFVTHISTTARDLPARDAIQGSLDLITSELNPLAASFFGIAESAIRTSVVAGSSLPPRELASAVEGWKSRLHRFDPLAPSMIAGLTSRIATPRDVERLFPRPGGAWSTHVYQRVAAVNDVRMLIRDGSRLIAGLTLWRRSGQDAWTPQALRLLAALQPLVEIAYLASIGVAAGDETPLPATLTRRQRQVARLLARGASNAEVARALQISPNTAKSHTRSVLAVLGTKSRRELALRYAPGSSPVRKAVPPSKRRPVAASIEGDDPARRLLAAALDWAVERLGAKAAGCIVLSARRRPVSGAWTSVPTGSDRASPSSGRRIQQLMLEPSRIAAMLRDADNPFGPVVLSAKNFGFEVDEEGALVARFRLKRPLVAALRRDGRIAGLVWFCRDADAGPADGEAALRAAHPLLQIALSGALSESGHRSRWQLRAADRGLTPRELAVARLALDGEGNARIAARLGISESTVKKHMTQILTRCDVRSRAQLIALLGDDGGQLDDVPA